MNVCSFVKVVYVSLSCPQCEKMDLKIIQSLLERVQRCYRVAFSDAVELPRTNNQPKHKNKIKTGMDHLGNNTEY